ncbi:DUF1778 domain-containing protein [Parafilimonas sp.]|uniref:type II toxin-antitoxin system TacA family antitoxin n=1 Tax=Parafilimonas sp. TaxID=1969739 RepID=UPI0039E29829
MKIVEKEKARFDTRLPKEQKEYFEYAARLGGFRNLTEFIVFSARQQASIIVKSHNSFLTSKKDQEIFFDTIMNPPKPNNALKKASSRFKAALQNK